MCRENLNTLISNVVAKFNELYDTDLFMCRENLNTLISNVVSKFNELYDTDLFMCGENLNTLISNVMSKFNELYLWCIRNKLSINCNKTNFMLSHVINKPILKQLDEIVTIDMTIKRVQSFQYLGLTID